MVPEPSLLVALALLIDAVPLPASAPRRGRPRVYPDRLFLKALVIMIVRHLPNAHTLLAVPAEAQPSDARLAPSPEPKRSTCRGSTKPRAAHGPDVRIGRVAIPKLGLETWVPPCVTFRGLGLVIPRWSLAPSTG